MSGELFRQDGKSKGERAVVQGKDGSNLNRKSPDGASVGEGAEKQHTRVQWSMWILIMIVSSV